MSREVEKGVAHRRGPDLSGPLGKSMLDEPQLLIVGEKAPSFPGEQVRVFTPRQNAVMGRHRREFKCRHCDFTAEARADAAEHVALSLHIVTEVFASEIVPVDMHDDWTFWEDGAGVSWQDRNPGDEYPGDVVQRA